MKKTDSIQLILLVIALLLGYNAVQTVPHLLWLLYHWFVEGLILADRFQNVSLNFLFLAFYIIGAVVLIKNSKIFSQKIGDAASFSSDINIILKKNDILYITIVAMGGYVLVTRLPKLLVNIYLYTRERNKPFGYDGPDFILPGETISEFIITIILAIIMIVYAKAITETLARHVEEGHDADEIGSKVAEN